MTATLNSSRTVTRLLERCRAGDSNAVEDLFPLVYHELRAIGARYMLRERERQTLQATALVHEAYLQLIPDGSLEWKSRAHFFGVAARSMRQILVEHARARHAAKRGGNARDVTLVDHIVGQAERSVDLLALDQALSRLAELDPRHAELVELRFFAGLTVEETAEVMGTSPATVKRGWAFAQAWLRSRLAS